MSALNDSLLEDNRVCIYHCLADQSFAERLADDLQMLGFPACLQDQECDFSDFERLVIVMSKQAQYEDDWQAIYQHFAAAGKLVCTARIDEVELPAELAAHEWVDFNLGYRLGVNGVKISLMMKPTPPPTAPSSSAQPFTTVPDSTDNDSLHPNLPPFDPISKQRMHVMILLAIVLLVGGVVITGVILNQF